MSKVKISIFIVLLIIGLLIISGTLIFNSLTIISGNEVANRLLGASLGLLLIALGGLILGS